MPAANVLAIAFTLALAPASAFEPAITPVPSPTAAIPSAPTPMVTLKNLARLKGLASWHGGKVALICQETAHPSDASSAQPDCGLAQVGPSGALMSLGRNGLLAAQSLPGDRMLLLSRDLTLSLRDAIGREIVMATSVAEPRASDDGSHVIYTQFAPGSHRLEPGLVGKLTGMRLADKQTRIITEDATASSPYPVPGSDEVVFLSARTGLASIWLAAPGKLDRQLTNVGKTTVDAQFIPVYGREWVWLPGGRKAVYTASYGDHHLWELDIDSGKARRLGPGRLPTLIRAGAGASADSILAVVGRPDENPQVVGYRLQPMTERGAP
jgi:hypothetical protein